MMIVNKRFASKSVQLFLGFAALLLVAGCEKKSEEPSASETAPIPAVEVASITPTL